MSRGRKVAITGAGAVTAFGAGVETLWEALLSGRTALRPPQRLDVARFPGAVVAEIGSLPSDSEEDTPQAARLALAAAREALAGHPDFGGPRVALVVGSTLGTNALWTDWLATGSCGTRGPLADADLPAVTRLLARRLGVRGAAQTVSVACASGTAAIGLGSELVRSGEADAALCGGYDLLSEFVFSGFSCLRALSVSAVRPFDARRDGLALGEGAAFVLLEEAEAAARAGRAPRALVRGFGTGADAHHMTRPSPDGQGLVRALGAAFAAARLAPAEVGFLNAHATATAFNDRMEAAAFRTVFGPRLPGLPVDGIKGAVGHTLGAAGALEAIVTALTLERGLAPPTAGLEEPEPGLGLDVVRGAPRALSARFGVSTSSAFAGTNAALVLERA